jgi:eukaryotic-like serine/threonine-protein kinase
VPDASVTLATLTPMPERGADSTSPGQTGGSPSENTEHADVTRPGDANETRAATDSQIPRDAHVPTLSAPVLRPGDLFGPRYRILRVLGAGGMGIVYHAWDQDLGEAVALKLIRSEVSSDPTMAKELEARFKRELLLARKVSHRNVVRIHDIGEVDGTKYISMSFLEGRDLATTLRTTGHLPVDRVVHFIKQLAAGLQEAHQAGVIHRDLKPANIMLEGNDLVIMDFGIARSALSPIDGKTGKGVRNWSRNALMTGATMQGAIVGTMAYMSPEQAKGEPADERSDIYSLGMVMRDMLIGMRQMDNPTDAVNELMARIEHAPKPVQSIDPTIPDDVDRVVTRCLQPDPAARFQSVQELRTALDSLDAELKPVAKAGPVNRILVAVLVLLAIAVPIVTWWLTRTPAPPVQHEPVSVVIADFTNGTGDPTFDRTLEPMLKIALEDAGFITAFDRTTIRRSLGVRPPDSLDERAAQEIAVKQGLGVVMSGALQRKGSEYEVSARAIHAVTGNELANFREAASNKTQILAVATRLASDVREALGDEPSDGDRRFAMETLSATSIDVVREYAAAADAMSSAKYDLALQHFGKAVEIDPNFGLGHAGLAIASRNLDRQQDAEKYIKQAVSHVGGMTERERYRTRGLYYMITGDPKQCVKEFGDLIERYAADASARNNLALCSTYLRDMPRAVEEMRKVIAILPKRALYRENLALYAAYGGDPEVAAAEASTTDPGLFALLAVAFSHLLKGDLAAASKTYEHLATADDLGASYRASGLGDLALYEGRFSEAAAIFTGGAAADVAAKETDRAANKYAALAYTEMLRGGRTDAINAAERALQLSTAIKIRFLAARVFTEIGESEKARVQRDSLAAGLQTEPVTYAKILEGLAALKAGDPRQAVGIITKANESLDTWIGHFDLGRAYFEAGAFTQADSEFDRCINRRGEALSLFLDEEPTFGFFPPVYYYQGRVREGLKSAGFVESYRLYLGIRGKSTEDPLVADVRRRTTP